MDRSRSHTIRSLYFEAQTVEGVKPLEIWSGMREPQDPFGAADLAKNLLKIAVPLVNESCSGRPFGEHARQARRTLAALIDHLRGEPGQRLLGRFPDPPTGEDGQKALYQEVREAARRLRPVLEAEPADGPSAEAAVLLPDGLFDFREMRLVDNELPFIIFTEKEYRVIHGMAIAYMWIIESEEILLEALERQGNAAAIIGDYRQFARRVREDNPLFIRGTATEAHSFVSRIAEELRGRDYLDVFEDVHRWYEQARERYRS